VRTVPKLNELYETGCRIFFYQTGQEVHLRTPIEVFMLQAQAFGAADYRDKVRAKTRDALRVKAQQGHVAGGKVYGYRQARGADGHVQRTIHEPEARIIRRLFELTASGVGLVRCAKRLNGEAIPSPMGRGWAPSAIRSMLYNDLYRGTIVYGKTRWTDKGGTSVKVRTPKSEWITRDAPHLRIVPEPLWNAAHARLAQTRSAYLVSAGGRVWGRPATGLDSRYLLTGVSTCAVCQGSLFVRNRPDGKSPSRPPRWYS